jgi:hypothetical protein
VLEVIESVIADEILPKPSGRYKKRSVEDTSKDERIFECDTLIVETTVGKIGEVSLTRDPLERSFGRRAYLRGNRIVPGRYFRGVMCIPKQGDVC